MAGQKQKTERRRSEAMLRGVHLALWCMVAVAAAPAQAVDGGHIASAAQVHGTPARPLAQPALRVQDAGAFGVVVVDRTTESAFLLRQRYAGQASVASVWPRQERSGMAVALTERLRVGLRYRYLEGEDLWPEFADTGATNYQSHHLLLGASWRF
jgi:hypothetical protein